MTIGTPDDWPAFVFGVLIASVFWYFIAIWTPPVKTIEIESCTVTYEEK